MKIPYGLHKDTGKLTSIDDVERGLACNCTCPACGSALLANKGNVKIHHFSHYQGDSDCPKESLLHILGKHILLTRIQNSIDSGTPIPISWSCVECSSSHTGNLVKIVTQVKKEVDLGPCRPDLVLYDQKGRVVAIIEVVVTHKPEHYVYDHCHNNNISLLIFRLYDSEDLDKLNDKLLYPSGDLICIAPRCSSCKGPLSLRKYYRTDIDCWKCNAQVPAGVISAGKVVLLPNEFNSMDKDIFGQHGVLLINNHRKRGGGFSVACNMCGAWDGKPPHMAKYSRGKDKKPVAEVLWCEKCKRKAE